MSKAKLTNECIKKTRAGIPLGLTLLPGDQVPNSVPDKIAVGRFYTEDGGCHIARTSRESRSCAFRPDGSVPNAWKGL